MGTGRLAKAKVTLEQLDRQAVTLDRLDTLMDRCVRLSERGVTWEQIVARRDEMNAVADDGVYHDVNDALQALYVEAFGPTANEEDR